ncbi:MAG TPA: hypothetical protein VK775_14175 [Chthoniobacterales bacterium]|nr:hypothetical protein [Chthoniobacterales bacterium]
MISAAGAGSSLIGTGTTSRKIIQGWMLTVIFSVGDTKSLRGLLN